MRMITIIIIIIHMILVSRCSDDKSAIYYAYSILYLLEHPALFHTCTRTNGGASPYISSYSILYL